MRSRKDRDEKYPHVGSGWYCMKDSQFLRDENSKNAVFVAAKIEGTASVLKKHKFYSGEGNYTNSTGERVGAVCRGIHKRQYALNLREELSGYER